MQRLHRAVVLVAAVGAAEPAGQKQIGQLRDQILQIQVVELVPGVFRVSILHGGLLWLATSCNTSSSRWES